MPRPPQPPYQKLLSALPASLLAPLTGSSRELYARILAEVYAETRRARQPLARDLVLDIIIRHTRASHAADDPMPRAEEALRHLQECGWLRVEIQPDFTSACALSPQAFQLLRSAGDEPPLAELLLAVHDSLQAALAGGDAEGRLDHALRVAQGLHDRLKELQHNAGDPQPLPSPEMAARLRQGIGEAAGQLEAAGHGRAREVRDSIQSLDRLLRDIADRRARAAASAARGPTADTGRLHAILAHLAAADSRSFSKTVAPLINLFHDASQAAGPTQDREEPEPAEAFAPETAPPPAPSPRAVEAARRETYRLINRPSSRERARRMAHALLQGRAEARAADFVRQGAADLPLLMCLRLYGDGSLGYRVEDLSWVEVGGIGFRDYLLKGEQPDDGDGG